jgi:hypothetical protein
MPDVTAHNLKYAFALAQRDDPFSTGILAEMLRRKLVRTDSMDAFGNGLLHVSTRIEKTRMLLKAGVKPYTRNHHLETPLHRAAALCDISNVNHAQSHVICQHLLQQGADVNAQDHMLRTPLYVAGSQLSENLTTCLTLLKVPGADLALMSKELKAPRDLPNIQKALRILEERQEQKQLRRPVQGYYTAAYEAGIGADLEEYNRSRRSAWGR